jgi:hypothetical protein
MCEIEGCGRPKRSSTAAWCSRHYFRWYRHGDPLAIKYTSEPRLATNGYLEQVRRGHPLARHGRQQVVLVHRAVLFERIGPGPHPCHWCASIVRWDAPRMAADQLVADHLDFDRLNNNPGNLVPSCNSCNAGRKPVVEAA